jgi:O-antigen/teichoic acid export membrane protein
MSGAIWSVVGAGLASGLMMVSNIACARLLGVARFGELAIVLATSNLFTLLFAAGLSMTASRYVAEHRSSDPKRAGTIIGLSSMTSVVVGVATTLFVLLLAPWLSREILHASGLSSAVSLAGMIMFFAALNGSQIGILSGLEAFNRVALGNLVRGVGIILFVILGAALGGVIGALLGHVAAGAVSAIFYQIAVRRECVSRAIRISYRFGREDLRILWRFTFPVLVTNLCFAPAAWWSNVLLANRSGYSEAGVFNAVFHWQLVIMFFSNAIANIGLPMLSNLRTERDPAKYKKCLAMNLFLTSAPAITIAIPVAIWSGFIMRLYGPAFEHGATALALISLAAVLFALTLPIGHVIWSLDATRSAVLLALLRSGVLVMASYALARSGATGLAGAYVIMGVIQTVVTVPFTVWILRRRLGPAVPLKEVALA